ncbi:MAG: 50S ribosomal protein L9 [Anaerolineae bacterium]|jgi:large subunit ribosomal protein L9|nr:MAG: 50S ribosomal protein L9 [Anaerolineae bacterium]
MKVLLLKDVHKLGRAGDVKKVADGYGRNYLIPQGLAVLATPGALKQAEHIREKAALARQALNQELSGVAAKINGLKLTFAARAGETGKLYGSITTAMIAEAIKTKVGYEVDRRAIDTQPIRNLGQYEVPVRLTVDLSPMVRVIVHREGEQPIIEAEATESEESQESQVGEAE